MCFYEYFLALRAILQTRRETGNIPTGIKVSIVLRRTVINFKMWSVVVTAQIKFVIDKGAGEGVKTNKLHQGNEIKRKLY